MYFCVSLSYPFSFRKNLRQSVPLSRDIILPINWLRYLNKISIKKFCVFRSFPERKKSEEDSDCPRHVGVRPCEVVTDGARPPKFRPLFGTLARNEPVSANAYYHCRCRSKRASAAADTIWDCPSRRETARFQEGGNIRVSWRARIRRARCFPLVSRDAASSRSGLPIPPIVFTEYRHPGGFFPRVQCAEVIYRGREREFFRLIRRGACHACHRTHRRRISLAASRERFSSAFGEGSKSGICTSGGLKELISTSGKVIIRLEN